MKQIELIRYARTPIALNVKAGDEVLIIADTDSDFTAVEALAAATFEVGGHPTVAVMTPREFDMQNPTRIVAKAMKTSDLNVLAVTKGLIHSPAAGEAMAADARFLNLEEVTSENLRMTRETVEEYERMQQVGQRLRDIWGKGSEFSVTAPAGTDIAGRIDGRPGYYVAGISQAQPGVELRSCAFPDGEAGVAPVAETVNGVLVFDIAMLHTGIGRLRTPITIEVRNGRIETISGGAEAERLTGYLEARGDDGARVICEVSIGLNPNIILNGSKNDKKKLGTMHFGFGANTDIGGPIESRLHYDGVVDGPNLEVDGKPVLKAGAIQ